MATLQRLTLATLLVVSTPLIGAPDTADQVPVGNSQTRPVAIQWRSWSEGLLSEAGNHGRLLLLDLTAPWCVFCRRMKTVTYPDPGVEAVIQAHYIPVRIDDVEHPQIASRYADYGRPASVVLDANGREVIRRSGYLEPQLMAWMLEAVARNPDPGAHR